MSERDDKFGWSADDLVFGQCAYCRHLAAGPTAVCTAFPGQIPPEILQNHFDHRHPWIDHATGQPGDQGVALAGSILFEPKPSMKPQALEALYRKLDQVGIV
jgi:hypothetical protein